MTIQIALALALFALVSSITPGPNNVMLLASGVNFGLRRSFPHMFGITGGFFAMILLVGEGIAGLFEVYPIAQTGLWIVSVAYLLYLALRIAGSGPIQGGQTRGRPMTFVQAAMFQWVNPKAWAMALTATTIYMPERSAAGLLAVALVFAAVNLPSVWLWAWTGERMAGFLGNPGSIKWFNLAMAGLLILSLGPVLWSKLWGA